MDLSLVVVHLTVAALAGTPAQPAPRLVIDRIEGDIAVVEIAASELIDLPMSLLPDGATEGSRLELVLATDAP